MTASGRLQAREVHALLEAGLVSGEAQPLPITEFPVERATDALRYLAAGTPTWRTQGTRTLVKILVNHVISG